jgi:plasmid stabilization system protein ParE
MIVRWSPEAAVDFAAIVEYIRQDNPSAAQRVAQTIYDGLESLASFPNKGRPGRTKALGSWSSRLCRLSPSIE